MSSACLAVHVCKSLCSRLLSVCRTVVVKKLQMSENEMEMYEHAKAVTLRLMQASSHPPAEHFLLFGAALCLGKVAQKPLWARAFMVAPCVRGHSTCLLWSVTGNSPAYVCIVCILYCLSVCLSVRVERQDLSCTYLAHHELESVMIIVIIVRLSVRLNLCLSASVCLSVRLERQDLSCTYLAHHVLESVMIIVTIVCLSV